MESKKAGEPALSQIIIGRGLTENALPTVSGRIPNALSRVQLLLSVLIGRTGSLGRGLGHLFQGAPESLVLPLRGVVGCLGSLEIGRKCGLELLGHRLLGSSHEESPGAAVLFDYRVAVSGRAVIDLVTVLQLGVLESFFFFTLAL